MYFVWLVSSLYIKVCLVVHAFKQETSLTFAVQLAYCTTRALFLQKLQLVCGKYTQIRAWQYMYLCIYLDHLATVTCYWISKWQCKMKTQRTMMTLGGNKTLGNMRSCKSNSFSFCKRILLHKLSTWVHQLDHKETRYILPKSI